MFKSGRIPSVQSQALHTFSRAPQANIRRSAFDRTHGHKTTFDAGYLVPVYVDEALPGDTFNLSMTGFARLATPLFPIMDNVSMESFFFAVPMRLIWDNWEKFNGAQDDPDDSTDFVIPITNAPAVSGFETGSLADYFGLPIGIPDYEVDAPFFRAYNLIWNEWFRDENLQSKKVVLRDDGPDDITNYTLLKRGKRYDYFSSCLPWPQKGPAVEIPLGASAPIMGNLNPTYVFNENNGSAINELLVEGNINTANILITGQGGSTPEGSMLFSTDSDQVGLIADLAS